MIKYIIVNIKLLFYQLFINTTVYLQCNDNSIELENFSLDIRITPTISNRNDICYDA